MQQLNFPGYEFRIKNSENSRYIFDPIRKKFVLLQPEEWVRQHVIQYLLRDKKYPRNHLNVEKQIRIHDLYKRYDVVVYRADGSISLLVECKAPGQKITQDVFDQIARYNLRLQAGFLMVTNGLDHYFCRMDYDGKRYEFLRELPGYGEN